MKKTTVCLLAVLMIFCVFCMPACGKYVSKFRAVACVHSNTTRQASLTYSDFTGTMVFKLKCKDGETLNYSGKVESGAVTVYYDDNGTKKELFSVATGEEKTDSLQNPDSGTLYIIVESPEKSLNGDFSFSLQ